MIFNIVTLGCSKNTVDSEVLAAALKQKGHQLLFDAEKKADIVLINTCSFIQDAKEESINEILEWIDQKQRGKVKKIYVIGCLAQRYQKELQEAMPEVDGFFGFLDLSKLLELPQFDLLNYKGRVLSIKSHFAYMKISEGCDRQCSFCAIPLIRGKQISKPVEVLVDEAKMLVSQGIKEIALIAQDSTAYGTDIYGKRNLAVLIEKLAQVEGIVWLRLHYAYPNDFPMEVLDVMQRHDNICRYLDMPLQHVNENVLKAMSRPSNSLRIRTLIETIRKKIPDIAIRTTLLSGFPTETATDHKELLFFLQDMQLDRVGVFSYSQEEGTPAFPLGDPISEKIKEQRKTELYALQEKISLSKNQAKTGKIMKVMVDGWDEASKTYIGRTEFDSPDVDGLVYIHSKTTLKTGEFYEVKITHADIHDLKGKFL